MRNFQNSLLILRKNKMEDNLNVGKWANNGWHILQWDVTQTFKTMLLRNNTMETCFQYNLNWRHVW
jgi:hypothetical protein